MPIKPLGADALFRKTDLSSFEFETTRDLEDADSLVGQERALGAVRFAMRMRQRGYNLFVVGPKGSGKHAAVRTYLRARAASFGAPSDWAYVNNFSEPHAPRALRLPAGMAPRLRDTLDQLVADLETTAPTLFESEDYQLRVDAIVKEVGGRQERIFEVLNREAADRGLGLMRGQQGISIVPVQDGEPMPPPVVQALPEEDRARIDAAIGEMQDKLRDALREVPLLEREKQHRVRDLMRSVASDLVEREIAEASDAFTDCPAVIEHFGRVAKDLVENIHLFSLSEEERRQRQVTAEEVDPTRRWRVNVLVTHDPDGGVPVVMEDHPLVGHLVGRIEHRARMGTMLTDFTLIKAGALHVANGGYLLLDARRMLSNPMSWDALKRSLYAGAVTIEAPSGNAGTATVVSLQPDPIPIDLKIVLFGDAWIHRAMSSIDPDFQDLFKVVADFETELDRTPENDLLFARLIATVARRNRLRAFTRDAVSRVIEHGAREVGDAAKVSTRVGRFADLMREANYWGREAGHREITDDDVDRAIEAEIHRQDRVRTRMLEQITRETVMIATEGAVVGQVNGLAVLQDGNLAFGKPSRITASVRVGTGRVVDIEREAALGGPLHSKGVLILSAYLSAHFALDQPISLSAHLTFEQSNGGVDGDSASSTELYAMLSALSGLPIRQGLAVTGSVDQKGHVQAIGGVNEKVEGFFDVCAARGLTGDQGVLVPAANAGHLMLRRDVVEACREGRFAVYAVATIAEGIELLTGVVAGERGADGIFPNGTVNRAVEDRLLDFAKARRRFETRD